MKYTFNTARVVHNATTSLKVTTFLGNTQNVQNITLAGTVILLWAKMRWRRNPEKEGI